MYSCYSNFSCFVCKGPCSFFPSYFPCFLLPYYCSCFSFPCFTFPCYCSCFSVPGYCPCYCSYFYFSYFNFSCFYFFYFCCPSCPTCGGEAQCPQYTAPLWWTPRCKTPGSHTAPGEGCSSSCILLLLHTFYFLPLTSYLLLHTSYIRPPTSNLPPHLYPPITMPVLHHDHQPRPALGEVVGGHAFPAFVSLASGAGAVAGANLGSGSGSGVEAPT